MRSKLAFLLLILGGVIASFAIDEELIVPVVVISIIGGFMCGFSYMLFSSVYSGKVWGIKIKSSTFSKLKQLIGVVGLVFAGYSLVITFVGMLAALAGGGFVELLIILLGFVIPLAVGPIIGKVFLEKTLAKEHNAAVLGEIPLFKEIDLNINNAVSFIVGFEGVALFSNTNYCFAVYRYENYQLGELSTPNEVAMVGTYFVQKYSDRFTFKVDVEVIPGTPGQTVVAVGTGGIGVARIQGTPDRRLFRSYIFTRKK